MSAVASKPFWLRPSLDWLLVFVPVAFALRYCAPGRNDTALFIVSALAIIPLAGWMGHAGGSVGGELASLRVARARRGNADSGAES